MSIDAQIWTFAVILLLILVLIGVPLVIWNVIVTTRRVLRWIGCRIERKWWEP